MKTVCSFETSQNTFPSTQHQNPKDQNHRPDGRENIKIQNTTVIPRLTNDPANEFFG